MATSRNDRVVAYNQSNEIFRVRIIGSELDTFSKFLRIPLLNKLSWIQMILALMAYICQTIAINLFDQSSSPSGRFMSHMDCSFWSCGIAICTATFTIWTLKIPIYWKIHLSFVGHLISVSIAIYAIIVEYIGNIFHIKYKVKSILYGEFDDNNSSGLTNGSRQIFIFFLVLKTLTLIGILVQLVISSIIALLTGRAIACGSNKDHRQLFNIEFDENEIPDHENNTSTTDQH